MPGRSDLRCGVFPPAPSPSLGGPLEGAPLVCVAHRLHPAGVDGEEPSDPAEGRCSEQGGCASISSFVPWEIPQVVLV